MMPSLPSSMKKLLSKIPKLSNFAKRLARVRELRIDRDHRQLWIEFKLWITDCGEGVQNYPNGRFTPTEADIRARQVHLLRRAGKPVPPHLLVSMVEDDPLEKWIWKIRCRNLSKDVSFTLPKRKVKNH